ncbi:alpha/beta hydrolase [Parasphingorhabdus flavimaris]|uniref:alpha/beta fold hydrolase n=1 Tax=Parasphingorhabdus flavimaris TaxID=266812 RepID=UPI0030037662
MKKTAIKAQDWIISGDYFKRSSGQKIFFRRKGAGTPVLLVHGFPTWSYDYAELAENLATDFDVITFDFLGYGASDKPRGRAFSVDDSSDLIEELLLYLGIPEIHLVIHNYGGIVGQELLDRRGNNQLSFNVASVTLLNCGIVYAAYSPTRVQKLLALPLLGRLVGSRITKEKVQDGLNAVRGARKIEAAEFKELWAGISRLDGHKLAHRHIRYNAERATHAKRWEDALSGYDGLLQLVWGLDDPVSGEHVLDLAKPQRPRAKITELEDVGHFPQSEAPDEVAAAIRSFVS